MKVRVLVIDDSFRARSILSDIPNADPSITVVGVTDDVEDALARIDELRPDLVLLDALSPGMGGGEPVRRLIARFPNLPLLVMLPPTELGASLATRVSATGAMTIDKPTSFLNDSPVFIAELRARIRAMTVRRPLRVVRDSASFAIARTSTLGAIVIGSSSGGPQALAKIFRKLPRDLSVPVFVAQHMPAIFTRMLADRLKASTGFPVREAIPGESPRPGHAYLAPGDFHLRVIRSADDIRMTLDQGPLENGCRPAVDVLFRSVARSYGAAALAVVLGGMGTDGARGADAIAKAGGRVITHEDSDDVVSALFDALRPRTAKSEPGRRPYGKIA